MPIPVPPGALPAAYRGICLRAVRAIARGHFHNYQFESASSKKCAYCTLLNEKCKPVPGYVGPEFARLRVALDAMVEAEGRGLGGDSEDVGVEAQGLREEAVNAARELALCVQVTTTQNKDLQPIDVLLANHYAMVEEIRGLKREVLELREEVAVWSAAASERASGAAPGGSGEEGVARCKGKGKGKALLRGAGGRFAKQTDAGRLSPALGGPSREDSDSEVDPQGDVMMK